MSYVLYDGEGYVADVASNSGWTRFVGWMESRAGEETAKLLEAGSTQVPAEVAGELFLLKRDDPPGDPEIASVLDELLAGAQRARGDVLVVTDAAGIEVEQDRDDADDYSSVRELIMSAETPEELMLINLQDFNLSEQDRADLGSLLLMQRTVLGGSEATPTTPPPADNRLGDWNPEELEIEEPAEPPPEENELPSIGTRLTDWNDDTAQVEDSRARFNDWGPDSVRLIRTRRTEGES